jgi:hypothetical protein
MLQELTSLVSVFTTEARSRPGAPTRRIAKAQHLSPIVTIFGGGIAGLSAAHELIERGFAVQVVEPERSPDEEYGAEVGGLARNQFGRVPENASILHDDDKRANEFRTHVAQVAELRSAEMQPIQPRFAIPWRIGFEADSSVVDPDLSDAWRVRNAVKLRAVWETLKEAYVTYGEYLAWQERRLADKGGQISLPDNWRAREQLYVEIRGHSENQQTETDNRELSKDRADAVLEWLRAMNASDQSFPQFQWHFKAVGVGSAEPLGDQRVEENRTRSNRVEFRIVEQLVPGEHGYRFFPAFYRHLFDTMRRTPILDENGHATGQTAYDRLVPTADLGLALGDGRPPASVQTRRVRSLEELRRVSDLFLSRLGVTHRDVVRFQVRMLKFLTSSPQRRAREYEHQSWWTFLGGDAERGYSPPMRHYLMETSQALVAMNAEETDARSQGNIVSQLQLHYIEDRFDFTLNGPTSEVWLRPWKRYLKRQGVRFFVGELARLRWKDDPDYGLELLPVTTHREGWLFAPVQGTPATASTAAARSPSKSDPDRRPTLVARPERRAVVVEVLDSQDGDYTVVVSGRSYCYTARRDSRENIAIQLTKRLAGDRAISPRSNGARVVIRQRFAVEIPKLGVDCDFDDSEEPSGGGTRKFREDWFVNPVPKKTKNRLLERFRQHDDHVLSTHQQVSAARCEPLVPRDAEGNATTRLELTDEEWVFAGQARAQDEQFEAELSCFERRWSREVVPRIKVDLHSRMLTMEPAEWVEEALGQEDEAIAGIYTLCPYTFRISDPNIDRAASIWIRVANASGNLRIVDEPTPEDPDPEHDYLSYAERPASLRPDFYVLALPLQDASRLVWRAESERPGTLHGCLAEILEFDRRTGRRTSSGAEIRPVRDAHGRPPHAYPLRDFAGVQYYFQNHVRIGKGHIYFPRAEWGLSSISQLAYWRERMSPAGPFMGQLSVDIGNFYSPGRARLGSRETRSAWNSTVDEIATEVWFQVRQGLERERAGILAAPLYFHVDKGLSFDGPHGSSFQNELRIGVTEDSLEQFYTVWVNGEVFQQRGDGTAEEIAQRLCKDIEWHSSYGTVRAEIISGQAVSPRPGNPVTGAAQRRATVQLRLQSTVEQGSATVMVTGTNPARFELCVGDKQYAYVHPAGRPGTAAEIRDGLFEALAGDPDLPVVARPSGTAAIVLTPRSADLPRIAVRNDYQQLDVIFGTTLRVRLEQCHGGLRFMNAGEATIAHNSSPFLINLPGQWRYRPGLFVPEQLTFEDAVLRPGEDERIRYRMSNRRWVAAGTYMATTTQLTTMEAANESARHAVNAILRCLAARPGNEYNSQGRVFADLADIFDPERYELDDLEPLKRLDRKLVEEGLPHVMDILKIIDSVDAMPMHGKPSHDPVANLLHLFQHIADGSDRDWSFVKQTLYDFVGQAVERVNDGVDPLGLLREFRKGPTAVVDRLRELLQGVFNASQRETGAERDRPPA